MEAAVVIGVVLYLLFHGHHYRKRRRFGCGFWVSMRGPFGTRETISKSRRF
jgi:hypothetical protein